MNHSLKKVMTRASSFALAVAMGATSIGADLFGINSQSGLTDNFSVSAAYEANKEYYDAGTMILNGYYNKASEQLTNDEYNVNWQTSDVTSCITDSDVTLPGTTDINDTNVHTMMCWADYLEQIGSADHNEVADYEVHGAIWGRENVNGDTATDMLDKGMLYTYVAKGVTTKINNDEIKIVWEIKAWRAWDEEEGKYIYPDDLGLTNAASIKAEWDSNTIFESEAPVWLSGNTRWSDWESNPQPLFIGYGTTTSCWSTIKTIPYGRTELNTSGLGGMSVAHVGYPDPDPNVTTVPFRLFHETADSANKNGMAIYEHVCVDIAAGRPCGHTYNELLNLNGKVPSYSIGSMLSLCWGETKDFLYEAYKEKKGGYQFGGKEVELTSFRLYDLNIQMRVDAEDVTTGTTNNFVRAYDNGNMIENIHATFKGEHGEPSLTSFADRLALSDRYDAYIAGGLKDDAAQLVDNDLVNTQHEFYYATSITYDVSADYQRSGGTIEAVLANDIVTIDTVATDVSTGTHVGNTTVATGINDEVTITMNGANRERKLTVKGQVCKVDAAGNATPIAGLTAEKDITLAVNETTKTFTMNFPFTSDVYAGQTLVVYQKVYNEEGTLLATHEDPEDEDQTVHYPLITTSAKDSVTGTNYGKAVAGAQIVDTVSYKNLIPGMTYVLKGSLMKKGDTGAEDGAVADVTTKEVVFRPATASGTIDVKLTFDATAYDGKSVVVYEDLCQRNGALDVVVTSHRDISDAMQTVSYDKEPITVTTKAQNSDNADSQIGMCVPSAHITDVVYLNNIIDNQEYQIAGQVYVIAENGSAEPLRVNDALVKSTVIRRKGNTQDYVNDTVNVTFNFDATGLAGKTLVIYEVVTEVGTGRVIKHEDPTDTDQMIYYPSIDTVAVDSETGDHNGITSEDTVIKDTVTLTNLIPGQEYTLEGTLKYVNAAGRSGNVKADAVKQKFTPDSEVHTLTMEIPFNSKEYNKHNIVVFESLKSSGESVTFVSHADLDDADQTVYYEKEATIIEIETDAIDGISRIQTGVCRSGNSIIDTITYKKADTDITYTVIGELYEVTGAGIVVPVLVGNVPVTAKTTFKPTADQGIATVTFSKLDTTLFAGKTLVVYEYIYEGTDSNGIIFGDPVASHEDPTDTRQMVYYPLLDTVAVDKTSNEHVGDLSDGSVIVDTVTYKNLLPGTKYTLQGSLMTRDDAGRVSAVIDATTNKPVVVTQDFTAEASEGTVVMEFIFDSTKYEGQDVVVYEQLMIPGSTIIYTAHDDISDADQTVHYKDTEVRIETDALNKITNSPLGIPSASDTIVDTITYKNLVPGTEYVAIGTLYELLGNNNVTIVRNGNTPVTAMTKFTPEECDGTIDVTFNFDSTAYKNKTLVVYEQVYLSSAVVDGLATGEPVVVHEDPADTRQQVRYTSLTTVATDLGTASSTGLLSKDSTIVDRVYYTGLEVGKAYEVVGTIYNKATGAQISERAVGGRSQHTLDEHGYVSAKAQFIPKTADGYVDVTFKFDSTPYAGKNLVVFEKLYKIDTMGTFEVASHEDINDYAQTISYPTVDTNAYATDGNGQLAEVGPKTRITDKVTLKNLVIGETYTIKGYLANQEGGAKIAKTDVEFTFTAEEETCTKYLEYTVNSTPLAGKTIVAVANLYTNDVLVCEHNDLDDYDQMIYFCNIETIASAYTGGKVLDPIGGEIIIDEVMYENLVPGNKYRLEGTVVNKLTERVISTASHTFTAVEEDGKTKMKFTGVNVRGLDGKQVVIFQTLYDITNDTKGVKVASLTDIDDANETLTVSHPTVITELTDAETGSKTVNADDDIVLIDKISYTGLVPGNDYCVVSTLVDKDTGKPIKDEAGNRVTVRGRPFTAQETTAEFESTFTFTNMDLAGKTVVAFNELYRVIDGWSYLVVQECDLNNAAQTVVFTLDPVIDTVATDVDTGSHTLAFTSSAKINDRVTYKGLKAGDTYTITATVYDKATGAPAEGIASVTKTFKADNKKGYVDVVIPVDAKLFSGKTLVVFEQIKDGEKVIATHEDINDLDQTIYVNKTDTVLTSGNRTSKTVSASKRVVLVDVVSFEGLTPGKTYQITGHILDRENSILASDNLSSENVTINADGEAELIIDGNEGSKVTNGRKIIATKTISFTPSTSKGSVAIEFTVNTSKLAGHHLVAFETITDKASGTVVGEHKDIYSASQTVTVKSSTKVYTGDICDDENCVYHKHD